MTSHELGMQARRCAERIRKENELAKLEYQFALLRGRWHAAIAALAKRGARADPALSRAVKKWGAILSAIEDRVGRVTLELAAMFDDDANN